MKIVGALVPRCLAMPWFLGAYPGEVHHGAYIARVMCVHCPGDGMHCPGDVCALLG
jgi:hypothetical protein